MNSPDPLSLYSMEELRKEIERRCRSSVIAYTTNDEDGAGYYLGLHGTTLEKVALAGRLLAAAERWAETQESGDDETDRS